jgi:hypothetical protein
MAILWPGIAERGACPGIVFERGSADCGNRADCRRISGENIPQGLAILPRPASPDLPPEQVFSQLSRDCVPRVLQFLPKSEQN